MKYLSTEVRTRNKNIRPKTVLAHPSQKRKLVGITLESYTVLLMREGVGKYGGEIR